MRTDTHVVASPPRQSRPQAAEIWCASDVSDRFRSWLHGADLDDELRHCCILHEKDRCIVAHCQRASENILLKRHVWGNRYRTLTKCWRQPAAKKCWLLSHQLRSAGVSTPAPLAYVGHYKHFVNTCSYLLSEFIPGDSLYHLLRYQSLSGEALVSLARQVAQLCQQLDALGVCHNDLKPENLIVDDQGKLWLIDLEMLGRYRKPSELRRRQLADVARLFHARSWRQSPEARSIFLSALLETDLGKKLHHAAPAEHVIRQGELTPHELHAGVKVVVRCQGLPGEQLPQATLDSVNDFADETILVYPRAGGQALGWHAGPRALTPLSPRSRQTFSWVLRLHEGEAVTPELAKEVQERVALPEGPVAYRTLVTPHDRSRAQGQRSEAGQAEIRLLRAAAANYCMKTDTFDLDDARCGEMRFPLWRLTGERAATAPAIQIARAA
jgi:serine/threonine protein kinase